MEKERIIEEQNEERLRELQLKASMTERSESMGKSEQENLLVQNERMKTALTKFNQKYLSEKKFYEEQIKSLEEKQSNQGELEEKAKDVDILLESIDSKEETIEELKNQLDEVKEYGGMIEELSNDKIEKEELIEDLKCKLEEIEELYKIEEELNETGEEEKKSLLEDIATRDVEVQASREALKAFQGKLVKLNNKMKKYQELVKELKLENEALKGQVEALGEEDRINKIQSLLNKVNHQSNLLRDAKTHQINFKLSEIYSTQSKAKMALFSKCLPQRLTDLAKIPSFEKYLLLEICKQKALLCIIWICEKYFLNEETSEEPNLNLLFYISSLNKLLMGLVVTAFKLEYDLANLSEEEYEKFANNPKFSTFLAAHSFLDTYLRHIKEDTLSANVDVDAFQLTVHQLMEFANIPVNLEISAYLQDIYPIKMKIMSSLLKIMSLVASYNYIYSTSTSENSSNLLKAKNIYYELKKTAFSLSTIHLYYIFI